MLRTWLEPHQISVPEDFIRAIGGNPLVSQVLYTRGLKDLDSAKGFLSPQYYHPAPSGDLPGLDKAVELLQKTINGKKTIGIWGDFDVDGQTSTTILVETLRQLGGNIIYHIPVRAEESHGINIPALQKFIGLGVDLILTCDTGISSHEAIEFAQSRGIPVIVTDHHDLPEVLPDAEAIVNPKMLPGEHPLSTLPGVGVAYKIVEALWWPQEEISKGFLDLVALGIVADIAMLKGDTRYLLQLGLDVLRNTQRVGLLAMMELLELNQSNLTEEHISFILAPRMNALGRLDDANSMVELLTTSDRGRARTLVLELEGMNTQRKLLSDQIYQAAQTQLTSDPGLLKYPVLVLSHPTWPSGVVGVVASRLVEQYHRPVLLLSAPPGGLARGSARSIEAINITAAIAANKDLIQGYGGHPMAAGLAIDPERIPEFRQAISRTVQEIGISIQVEKDLQIESYLSVPELTIDLVEDLERLAPFGAGNPALVFATRNLKLIGYAAVGRASEHLQLTVEDELGHLCRCIWWQGASYQVPEAKFDLAYSVRASTYRGQREVQIEWIDYRLVEPEIMSFSHKKSKLEIIDFRGEPDPLIRINQLQAQDRIVIWGEAGTILRHPYQDRYSLQPAEKLAIWTIPPGPNELQSILEVVKPSRVYLFAINPDMDQAEAFLKRLVGLLKNRIMRHNGIVSLRTLTTATAQRAQTIGVGLEWLEANGYIRIISTEEDIVHIDAGNKEKVGEVKIISSRLNALLAESAAFRRYYLSANKDRLIAYDV